MFGWVLPSNDRIEISICLLPSQRLGSMPGLWLVEDDDGAKYATQCSLVDAKELAHKLHCSLWAESWTHVWQKWNLWSRFTSAVLQEWKDVRIFMESMCPSSQNHWSKTNRMPVRCCFCQFSENSHQFIRDHLLQRCLKCCGCCTGWLATLFGDDPLTTSLGWCKRLGVFLKMHGASKKSDILWFSLLESRHFKEGFLNFVGA